MISIKKQKTKTESLNYHASDKLHKNIDAKYFGLLHFVNTNPVSLFTEKNVKGFLN